MDAFGSNKLQPNKTVRLLNQNTYKKQVLFSKLVKLKANSYKTKKNHKFKALE